mgnify:CR=1 FL=1
MADSTNDVLPLVPERAAEEPFVDPPLFGRLGRRERVARVERARRGRSASPRREYCCVPGLVRISTRPRPGREYSAEYGSWLIRICCIADALTLSALTSMPLTTIGDAAVADRSGVEELRHRRDEVVVEDRQAVEHVLVDGDRVDVVAGGGADLGRRRC